MAVNEDQV